MNREFNPTSRLARTIFATGSVIVSLLIVSSITTLAEHYADAAVSAQQVEVAQH